MCATPSGVEEEKHLTIESLSCIELKEIRVKKLMLIAIVSLCCSPLFVRPASAAAICNDGTYSPSSGPGTCSHHGGVKRWL
jgi:Protein of unknown function (DUF3761)